MKVESVTFDFGREDNHKRDGFRRCGNRNKTLHSFGHTSACKVKETSADALAQKGY